MINFCYIKYMDLLVQYKVFGSYIVKYEVCTVVITELLRRRFDRHSILWDTYQYQHVYCHMLFYMLYYIHMSCQ